MQIDQLIKENQMIIGITIENIEIFLKEIIIEEDE